MQIIFTATALKETEERLFPASKNRSRRIHKKLVNRHGGEFRKDPAMWQVGGVIYAHPIFKPQFDNIRKAEPLGEPFRSILQNNLWDLYAR